MSSSWLTKCYFLPYHLLKWVALEYKYVYLQSQSVRQDGYLQSSQLVSCDSEPSGSWRKTPVPTLLKLLNACLLLTLCVRTHHNAIAGEGVLRLWAGRVTGIPSLNCSSLNLLPVSFTFTYFVSWGNNTSQQREKNTIDESTCRLQKGIPSAISHCILSCQPYMFRDKCIYHTLSQALSTKSLLRS